LRRNRRWQLAGPELLEARCLFSHTGFDWDAPHAIALRSRTFVPPSGVDPELVAYASEIVANQGNAVHFFAQLSEIPDAASWQAWAQNGVYHAGYLGDGSWVLRATVSGDVQARLNEVQRTTSALSMARILPPDKTTPSILSGEFEDWAINRELVNLTVSAFVGAAAESADMVLHTFHRGAAEDFRSFDNLFWDLSILPGDLPQLLELEFVASVDQTAAGLGIPLSNDARALVGADAVQMISPNSTPPTYLGLSGKGVHFANGEGLDPAHDDFWNHDASGNRTTARWTANAVFKGAVRYSDHGAMTAGTAIGNGFMSNRRNTSLSTLPNNGGYPYQWRGIAPEALYEAEGSTADVSNVSVLRSVNGTYAGIVATYDQRLTDNSQPGSHPYIVAAGNNGLDPISGPLQGYQSILAPMKNPILVGKVDARSAQWGQGSLGPTFDGRLKPDLVAPAHSTVADGETVQAFMEIDEIRVYSSSGLAASWDFIINSGTSADFEGWPSNTTNDSWLRQRTNLSLLQSTGGRSGVLRIHADSPANDGFIATSAIPTGSGSLVPLNLNQIARVEVDYRADPPLPAWQFQYAGLTFGENTTTPANDSFDATSAPISPDGNWHTATFVPNSATLSNVDYLRILPFLNARFGGMERPSAEVPTNGYSPGGGTSNAAPVVAGATALLLEKMRDDPSIGITLQNHSQQSPFWRNAAGGLPSTIGNGVPLPSTFKALFLQTARDLAYTPDYFYSLGGVRPGDVNPDTGKIEMYGKGPDYYTGYGLVDIEEAVRLLDAYDPSTRPFIVERQLGHSQLHRYNVQVDANQDQPLVVTMAWDDPPALVASADATPKLVNNLDLELVNPAGTTIYLPWTLLNQNTPATLANFGMPAQRKIDDLNNVEQVSIENPMPGTWQVRVIDNGIAQPDSAGGQKYSLILGTPPKQAPHLAHGKIVFVSDRPNSSSAGLPQLWIKDLDGGLQQLTSESFGAWDPAVSRDGRYVTYVTKDVITGGGQVDVLKIIDIQGNFVKWIGPPVSGNMALSAPAWQPDGKTIAVTYSNAFGSGIVAVDFSSPYNFANWTSRQIIPDFGLTPSLKASDPDFSPDGKYMYFHADTSTSSGGLYVVPSTGIPTTGGWPARLFADGNESTLGSQVSVSPDGDSLMFRSRAFQQNPSQYLSEEIVGLRIKEGVTSQLTKMAGNQSGSYAIGGAGEFVLQSNAAAGATADILIQENGVRLSVSINDPSNQFHDHSPVWFKTPPDEVVVPSNIGYCNGLDAVAVPVVIWNKDPYAAHTFSYYVTGIDAGGSFVSGKTQFTYQGANPVTVPAGGSRTVYIQVTRPPGMSSNGQTAVFRVVATNLDTGLSVSDDGSVQDHSAVCAVKPRWGGLSLLSGSAPLALPLTLENTSGQTLQFEYKVAIKAAKAPSGELALENLAPGELLTGQLTVPAGGMSELSFSVRRVAESLATANDVEVTLRDLTSGVEYLFSTAVLESATVIGLPGDYDANGTVDGTDFLHWQRQLSSSVAFGSSADGNGDSFVDGADLTVWRATFGQSAALPFTQFGALHNAYQQFMGTTENSLEFDGRPGAAAEGDPASVEDLDGYDGTFRPDGDIVFTSYPNHVEPFTFTFTTPVATVGSFIGTGKEGTIDAVTINAFDANDNLLISFQAKVRPFADPDNREGFWAVKSDAANISKVSFLNDSPVNFANALILGTLEWSLSPSVNGLQVFGGMQSAEAISPALRAENSSVAIASLPTQRASTAPPSISSAKAQPMALDPVFQQMRPTQRVASVRLMPPQAATPFQSNPQGRAAVRPAFRFDLAHIRDAALAHWSAWHRSVEVAALEDVAVDIGPDFDDLARSKVQSRRRTVREAAVSGAL
jgi:hypothetical protein